MYVYINNSISLNRILWIKANVKKRQYYCCKNHFESFKFTFDQKFRVLQYFTTKCINFSIHHYVSAFQGRRWQKHKSNHISTFFFVKLYFWRKTWLLCPIRTVTFTTIPPARREIRANFDMSLWRWIKKQNVDFGNLENVLQLIACLGKTLKKCRHIDFHNYQHSVEKRKIDSLLKISWN